VATSIPQKPQKPVPYGPAQRFVPMAEPTQSASGNPVYAHAMLGCVLGVLFAVAVTSPLRPNDQPAVQSTQTAQVSAVVHSPSAVPAVPQEPASPQLRDMGLVSSGVGGLKGHLSTSWTDKLVYKLELGPDDPAQHDAFAMTVNDPPRPLSVQVELKSAAGQVICNQKVVLKYDPRRAVPSSGADLSQLEAQEVERERASDVFQSGLGKDGQIESITSQGSIPCSKQAYEGATYWSFSPQFPDLREQASLMKAQAAEQVAVKAPAPQALPAYVVVKAPAAGQLVAAVKAPEARVPTAQVKNPAPHQTIATVKPPAAHQQVAAVRAPEARIFGSPVKVPARLESVAAVSAPAALPPVAPVNRPAAPLTAVAADAPEAVAVTALVDAPALPVVAQPTPVFTYQIEGDDEIVEVDAVQKSIETSAGKTFFVQGSLMASDGNTSVDTQTNVHYRCDQNSSCTLSLADATVLHATMRMHRTTLVPTELSMTDIQSSPQDGSVVPATADGLAP
jgi:hypothetical protein